MNNGESSYNRCFTTGRDGLAQWPRAVRSLVSRAYTGAVCLTAEYTDETCLETNIAQDLVYVRTLFREAADE